METFSEPAALASPSPRIAHGVPAPLSTQALVISGNRRHTRQGSQPNNVLPGGKALARTSAPPVMERRKKLNSPLQWTVNEVVEWLKSKGFGPAVCDKFVEQDITGDVLLALDINLLKAEMGILAFGNRMRISNAIAELRQPPSGSINDSQPQHAQSVAHLVPQLPYLHSPSWSAHQSLNSPLFTGMGLTPNPSTLPNPGVTENPDCETFTSPLLSKRLSGFSTTGASVNGYVPTERINDAAGVEKAGLAGIAGRDRTVPQEPQLESAASERALTVLMETEGDAQSAQGAAVSPAVRHGNRHLYDRPVESAAWGNENVEGSETPGRTPSPTRTCPLPFLLKPREPEEDVISNLTTKKSMFSGRSMTSIGRLRKSPRTASTLIEEKDPTDKISSFGLSLSRLYNAKKAPRCPSTPDTSSVSIIENGMWPGHQRSAKKKEIKKAKSMDMLWDVQNATPKAKPTGLDEDDDSPRMSTLMLQDVNEDLCGPNMLKLGKSVIEQIKQPDHQGWMRKKGDRYKSWKVRYFIIKGPHLYILRSDNKAETKVKEYVNIAGYKVVADKNIDPGRYGFRIVHETDKTHSFSSEEQTIAHEWMKAITKPTIARDYSAPVMSSVDVPTVPLEVAQAMNPPPRPPSPLALAATQRAWRREHPSRLSPRDARVLMGLPSSENVNRVDDKQEMQRMRAESFPSRSTEMNEREHKDRGMAPHRPTRRATRRPRKLHSPGADNDLVAWANAHLPRSLQVTNSTGPSFGGLALLRLAEDIMGKSAFPPIPDSVFPSGPDDDKLDGLFYLFDFLHDNDVKTGMVSINDIRHGKRDKVSHILKALKAQEEEHMQIILGLPNNGSKRSYRAH